MLSLPLSTLPLSPNNTAPPPPLLLSRLPPHPLALVPATADPPQADQAQVQAQAQDTVDHPVAPPAHQAMALVTMVAHSAPAPARTTTKVRSQPPPSLTAATAARGQPALPPVVNTAVATRATAAFQATVVSLGATDTVVRGLLAVTVDTPALNLDPEATLAAAKGLLAPPLLAVTADTLALNPDPEATLAAVLTPLAAHRLAATVVQAQALDQALVVLQARAQALPARARAQAPARDQATVALQAPAQALPARARAQAQARAQDQVLAVLRAQVRAQAPLLPRPLSPPRQLRPVMRAPTVGPVALARLLLPPALTRC